MVKAGVHLMVGRVRQLERQSTKESRRSQLGGVVFVAHEYQTIAVSYTKPVNGFCEGIYQSVALHLTTCMGLFSVD